MFFGNSRERARAHVVKIYTTSTAEELGAWTKNRARRYLSGTHVLILRLHYSFTSCSFAFLLLPPNDLVLDQPCDSQVARAQDQDSGGGRPSMSRPLDNEGIDRQEESAPDPPGGVPSMLSRQIRQEESHLL
jgi:hypothetical protein